MYRVHAVSKMKSKKKDASSALNVKREANLLGLVLGNESAVLFLNKISNKPIQ